LKKKVFIVLSIFIIIAYLASFLAIKLSYESIESLEDPDSKFVEVCGINVHFKESGQGEKTILLIHGFGASIFSFRYVFAALSKHFKVVALDLPGFGLTERVSKSSCEFDPYSRMGQVEIVEKFIETLDLKSVYVVGHSMGGTVATILSIQQPQLIKGLILEDSAIYEGGGSPKIITAILKNPIGRVLFPLFAYPMVLSLQRIIKIAYFNQTKVTEDIIKGYKKSLRVKNWDYGLYRIITAQNQSDFIDRIPEINIPVLIITGKEDKIVKPENSEKLASIIAKARLMEVSECGHIPHEEAPEVFIDAVIRFIEESDF